MLDSSDTKPVISALVYLWCGVITRVVRCGVSVVVVLRFCLTGRGCCVCVRAWQRASRACESVVFAVAYTLSSSKA